MPATRSTPSTPTAQRRHTPRPGLFTPTSSTARRSTTHPPASPALNKKEKPNVEIASPYPPVPPEDEHLWDVLYTDGACSNNGRAGAAQAGIGVWSAQDEGRRLSERCPGEQTNNRAELIAIIRALEETPYGGKQLLIKTDSTYAIGCMYSWISRWNTNGWLTSAKQPVKNRPVIEYLAKLLELRRLRGHTVLLQHVRGHAGTPGNEAADALARAGALLPLPLPLPRRPDQREDSSDFDRREDSSDFDRRVDASDDDDAREDGDWDWAARAARVQDEIDGELLAGGDAGPESPRKKRKREGEVLLMSPRKRAREEEQAAALNVVHEEEDSDDEFGDVDDGWMDAVPEEELAKLDSSPAKPQPLPPSHAQSQPRLPLSPRPQPQPRLALEPQAQPQTMRRTVSSASASEFGDAEDPFADLTDAQLDALDPLGRGVAV